MPRRFKTAAHNKPQTFSHPDVEYAVDTAAGEKVFSRFAEAAAFALGQAIAGSEATLDVLVHSKAGARFVAGDEGVEMYEEDPDASVFQRFEISVNYVGRVA